MADGAPFCPYVGLRPFNEEDRPYFFGRESEIDAIANNLYGARLTIFYGASGVGKSSVLMAGVVPVLRQEPRTAVVVFRRWQVPQAATQLKLQIIEAATAAAGRSVALDEGLPLDELLKRAADALDGTILLLLDQFEEYFLYIPDPGPEGGFDAELARAINRRDVDAGFLISMREDSLSKLDRFRKYIPTMFGNTQRLVHLWLGAARLAIEKPLEVYNVHHPDAAGKPVTIEPALVQALLDQVSAGQVSIAQGGGAGQVGAGQAPAQAQETHVEAPYLQLVLERLWAQEMNAGSRQLRLATLDALGGANNIVRTHLDQVMEQLTPADQELCARVFDRLVTPSGAKLACRLRDLANWAEDLAGEVPRVTKVLQDNRLLAKISAPPGAVEEDDQYQIFHDVLAQGILNWRSRFLQRKETQEAEAAAAQREREAAEDRRRADEAAAREREVQLLEERAREETRRAESERGRAEQERRLRKRFQYAMFAFVFALAWAAWFGYSADRARQDANDAQHKAEVAAAALLVEKVRDRYAKQPDADGAIAELKHVLELDPDSAAAYETLGRVYYDRGIAFDDTADIDRAIDALDKSLALDPRQVHALVARAAARQYQGNFAGALADYDAAIADDVPRALAPADGQLYFGRGAVHEAAGERAAAIADYSKAISLQPDFDDAYLARGELYDREGNHDQAIDDLQLALKYANDDRTRLVAKTWLSKLGAAAAVVPQTGATVYVHIVDPNDRSVADAVKRALEQQGYRVEGIQTVAGGRTNGDVRYIGSAQQRIAEAVAKTVEIVLAREGRKLTVRALALDARKFPQADQNVLEVWLPSLSGSVTRELKLQY